MTLLSFYNESLQAMYGGNYSIAATSLYETAFYGMWPYLIILVVISVMVFIKTRNLGLLGVICALMGEVFIQLGKFPVYFHYIPFVIFGISMAITLFLFFTDRDYS